MSPRFSATLTRPRLVPNSRAACLPTRPFASDTGIARAPSGTGSVRCRSSGISATEHGVNAGLEYSHPLSAARRMSFAFNVGSSVMDTPASTVQQGADTRLYRVYGDVAASWNLSRSWTTRATYRRGLEYIPEFTQPVFVDGFTAEIGGLCTSRLEILASTMFASGASAVTDSSSTFDTSSADVRVRYAITSTFAVYGEYIYYRYDFRDGRLLAPGIPPGFERNGDPCWSHVVGARAAEVMVLPGKTYTLEEIVRILLDRRWLVVLPLVLGTLLGVLAYRRMPAQYRSETLIMVVPQRVPDSYVKSTVTANVEDRLRSISEQILSRSRLERIIQDFEPLSGTTRTGMADGGRRSADARRHRREARRRKSRRFESRTAARTRSSAQKVTERLASLFIEENLRDRENLAEQHQPVPRLAARRTRSSG